MFICFLVINSSTVFDKYLVIISERKKKILKIVFKVYLYRLTVFNVLPSDNNEIIYAVKEIIVILININEFAEFAKHCSS